MSQRIFWYITLITAESRLLLMFSRFFLALCSLAEIQLVNINCEENLKCLLRRTAIAYRVDYLLCLQLTVDRMDPTQRVNQVHEHVCRRLVISTL